jgi:hypothetical protein
VHFAFFQLPLSSTLNIHPVKIQLSLILVLSIAYAQGQKITIRTVTPVDVNSIVYPNMSGNTTSSMAHKGTVKLKDGSLIKGKVTLFKKKDVFSRVKVNTGEEKREIMAEEIAAIELDPIINERQYANNFKNPEKNFQPGYILLPTGDKLIGKVAQLRDFSDYDFFVYNIAFLPTGSSIASTFKGGRLVEFGQEINGTLQVWDGYVDGYLLRLTDGRFRLSRNPYSKTKNEFFTAIKDQAVDSLSKQAMGQALASSLTNGQNLNESMENAANLGSVVSEVLGGIEINRKEYLIFDTRNKTVISVNKKNLQEELQRLAAPCAGLGTPTWENIQEFVTQLNKCQ